MAWPAVAERPAAVERHVYLCTNGLLLDRFYGKGKPHERRAINVHLDGIGIDGMLLSPGYHHAKLDDEHFLVQQETHRKFARVLELAKKYRINSTPLFLEFAAGRRDYPCTPWGTPNYTPKGWKGPCYVIEDGYHESFDAFMKGNDWSYWESRNDPRCRDCAMHSGFEPSVVRKMGGNLRDVLTMMRWQFAA